MNHRYTKTRSAGECPARRAVPALLGAAVLLAASVASSASAATAPHADLATKSFAVPTSAKPGDTLSFTMKTKNAGKVRSVASKSTFALSADASPGNDVAVGTKAKIAGLRPGKSATSKVTLSLPATLPDGSWYVIACADASKKVRETKERNNCHASANAVRVTRAFTGNLSGTLTFTDKGQSASGLYDEWNVTATASIKMSVSGPSMNEVFASTGSTYSLNGTRDDVNLIGECSYERHRVESGAGTLAYTANPYTDDISGDFDKTDLSAMGLVVDFPYTATTKEQVKGPASCDPSETTTTTPSRDSNDIKFREVSRTATTITYRAVEWYGLQSTKSEWDTVSGDLVLTRTS